MVWVSVMRGAAILAVDILTNVLLPYLRDNSVIILNTA